MMRRHLTSTHFSMLSFHICTKITNAYGRLSIRQDGIFEGMNIWFYTQNMVKLLFSSY